ncbi:hypothetical protein ACQZV8_07485 [Magnetococcales bacterium HHB-1]
MKSKNRYHGIDSRLIRFLRFEAKRLCQLHFFISADLEDIEQELALATLRRTPRTYSVIKNAGIDLIRKATRAKRNYGQRPSSLFDTITNRDGQQQERINTLSSIHSLWGRPYRNWHEVIDLRLDLLRWIETLSAQEQRLIQRLVYKSIAEISESTGQPKSTLYSALYRIRHCAQHTLH